MYLTMITHKKTYFTLILMEKYFMLDIVIEVMNIALEYIQ